MSFYLLEQDLRVDGNAQLAEVPRQPEPLDWLHGKPLPDPGPLRLRLSEQSGDVRGDLLTGLLPLMSSDLKDALTDFGVETVDYFPVELEDGQGEVEDGYWLANVRDCVEAVDLARSTIEPRPSGARGRLLAFEIDETRVEGKALFRLVEAPTLIVISAELRAHLRERDLSCVRLRATHTYDGY